MRIGQGFDIHALILGRPLMIGGYCVPAAKGEKAHSDGDVLLHALIDAILGSQGLADIGTYFPPTDPKYKDIPSSILLDKVLKMTKIEIENVDITIILETPRLGPHVAAIKQTLSQLLSLDVRQIGLKAKTAEHMLGELGNGDAIVAEVVLLAK